MVNDPVGDMIARIKNAAMRGRSKVSTPASKMRARVLDVLAEEGYIRGYSTCSEAGRFPGIRDRAEVLRRSTGDR
jgi:small subunit ribosomal protein S8